MEKAEQGEVVSNQDLIGVASIMNQSIYNEKWTPSKGWLGKFKARYSLNTSKHFITEESPTSNQEQEVIVEMPATEHDQIENIKDVAKISVLNAADILLDFINDFDFPLKEVITLRITRDKISEMSEAKTMYEVMTREPDEDDDEDDLSEIGMKNDEENKN